MKTWKRSIGQSAGIRVSQGPDWQRSWGFRNRQYRSLLMSWFPNSKAEPVATDKEGQPYRWKRDKTLKLRPGEPPQPWGSEQWAPSGASSKISSPTQLPGHTLPGPEIRGMWGEGSSSRWGSLRGCPRRSHFPPKMPGISHFSRGR